MIVTIVLLVLVLAVIVACTRKQRRQPNVKHPQYSYIPGRKHSQQSTDNLWIQQNGARFVTVLENTGTIGRVVCEVFVFLYIFIFCR